jgi:hypothetical protein
MFTSVGLGRSMNNPRDFFPIEDQKRGSLGDVFAPAPLRLG